MKHKQMLALALIIFLSSCSKYFDKDFWDDKINERKEDPSTFQEISSIDIGETGAAEITAFDPITNRLFVVNNAGTNRIDVVDMKDPNVLSVITTIDLAKYNGAVNSLAVHDGLLAAAIESNDKQQPGKAVVFNTVTYEEIKVIGVGALPDMITFSADGKYILTANEGEPNSDYTIDPYGTVSIISVKQNFSAEHLDFSSMSGRKENLMQRGLRIFGPNAKFSQDIEPEYITVSKDSKIAWVTLQENNAIAVIDLQAKFVKDIFPLGFKDYSAHGNGIDASDKDGAVSFPNVPVYGMYLPDAIAVLQKNGVPYLFTANEGDVREYDSFEENERVADITLDPAVFPDAAAFQEPAKLGRLNITKTLGDKNHDGKYEALYSFGTRSISVWNGLSGQLLYDSKNNIEEAINDEGYYDDGRSDDKGVEPEGIAIGEVGGKDIAFVGMERADAVAVYDVSEPQSPKLLQVLKSGDAPEGILFIDAKDSPNKRSLLVVSSEEDGVIKVYQPAK
jgi:hypothetical protein